MGLKKYEIITVGGDKRVRALRSWQVGDRYVNIGDVGGIVYDEKTLSQDGTCWLFRGNFNFPGARIGGDSIVDVGEAAAGTVAPGCRGLLTMKDDARIENGSITALGHITLCGKYKQTANKTWTGKRVIGSQDAPTYDDNVKTQYDF